jgi:hypothetical protein
MTRDHIYSSSNAMLAGNREIRAEVTVRRAVRAALSASATPLAWAGEAQLVQAVGQSRDARC